MYRILLIVICLIYFPAFTLAHEVDHTEGSAGDNVPNLSYAQNSPQTRLSDITGSWDKEFIQELKTENRDPRWTLNLEFTGDGQFVYHTSTTEEVRFVNKGGEEMTRPVIHDTRLKGTYTITEDNLILDFIAPSESDIEILTLNLGYNPNSHRAVIKAWQQGEYLAMQGLGSPRQIFFRRSY